MRIFVTGGTGLIGGKLIPSLLQDGHEIDLLTRRPQEIQPQKGVRILEGDPTQPGKWLEELAERDAVIHLAGEPIVGKRWSRRFKERVRESRIVGTRLLAEQLAKTPKRKDGSPKIFLSSSAIGYYGLSLSDEQVDESSPPGNDFLAEVCVAWEKATQPAEDANCRVVHIRTGIVLDSSGGALPKMVTPFKWFVGGVIASGKQWMSWIHVADMVGIIKLALEREDLSGPINAVSPEPIKNWGFCKSLGKILHRPCWFPIPGFLLRIVIGQGSSIVTKGQRVRPKVAEKLGYSFQFTDLEKTLQDLLLPKDSLAPPSSGPENEN